MTGIEEALARIGNATALGRKLVPPVTRQAVAEWAKRGWVPSERAAQISALTGIDTDRLIKPSLVRAVKGTRLTERNDHGSK